MKIVITYGTFDILHINGISSTEIYVDIGIQ